MQILKVNDFLKDRILVSRESARLLESRLRALLDGAGTNSKELNPKEVTIDFEGIEGVAPSFVDELLVIFDSIVGDETDGGIRSLIVAHPPTRLSSKFEAIARGHKMSIQTTDTGSWLLQRIVS